MLGTEPPEQAHISRGPSHLSPALPPPAFHRAVISLAAGGPCVVPTLGTDGRRGRLVLSGPVSTPLGIGAESEQRLQLTEPQLVARASRGGGRGSMVGGAQSAPRGRHALPRSTRSDRATLVSSPVGREAPGNGSSSRWWVSRPWGPPRTSSSSSSLSRAWGSPPT